MRLTIALLVTLTSALSGQTRSAPPIEKGQRLEDLAWPEAERFLTPDTIVVIPLGAASKEHGPHLKLRNDLTVADYLTRRVVDAATVVVAPTLTYHYYPAFVEYPGSTTLSLSTARDRRRRSSAASLATGRAASTYSTPACRRSVRSSRLRRRWPPTEYSLATRSWEPIWTADRAGSSSSKLEPMLMKSKRR
jgi:hypothetical protein